MPSHSLPRMPQHALACNATVWACPGPPRHAVELCTDEDDHYGDSELVCLRLLEDVPTFPPEDDVTCPRLQLNRPCFGHLYTPGSCTSLRSTTLTSTAMAGLPTRAF